MTDHDLRTRYEALVAAARRIVDAETITPDMIADLKEELPLVLIKWEPT